ncbi:cytochrome bd oxidase small subunit CydS [Gracilibacillus boraciitolerans]
MNEFIYFYAPFLVLIMAFIVTFWLVSKE